MPFCQLFRQKIGEFRKKLPELRELLLKYRDTGDEKYLKEIEEKRNILYQEIEEFREKEYIPKVKELLEKWFRETTKGKRRLPEFHFTKERKVEIDILDIAELSLSSFYLPKIIESIKILYCYGNRLTSLPELSRNLQALACSSNQLTSLPELPKNLQKLYCEVNQLTFLPELPENLRELYCSSNQLTSLPELPDTLVYLDCRSNPLTKETIEKIKRHPKYIPALFVLYINSEDLKRRIFGIGSRPDCPLYLYHHQKEVIETAKKYKQEGEIKAPIKIVDDEGKVIEEF